MKIRNFFAGIILAFFIGIMGNSAFRQPPGGPPPGGSPAATGSTPPCWSPPCIPIDGGLGFLLAAGAFVRVRKLYRGTTKEA